MSDDPKGSEAERFARHAKMARAAFGDDYRGRCIIEDICRWIAAQERQREERERDEATRAMR